MSDLRFISDEQLRSLVERDKKELDSCLENHLCKSTLLLAGSIIEAILVDFFLTFPRSGSSRSKVLKANLANLIDWAEQEGLITDGTKQLSTVIRNYRNLIHPGREYRLQERVDINTATVAANLVEIIVREVAENYATKLGYTAEQAIAKVKIDPSCTSIFQHMIDQMVVTERVKLFRSIPDECWVDDPVHSVTESFVKLHDLLKRHIQQDIVREEASRAYDLIRDSSREEAMFFLRFFAGNLSMLETDKRQAVIAYLLSALEDSPIRDLVKYTTWGLFTGLGNHLNSDEGVRTLNKVVLKRLQNTPPEEDQAFLSALYDVVFQLDTNRGYAIADELKKHGEWTGSSRAHDWERAIRDRVIPF